MNRAGIDTIRLRYRADRIATARQVDRVLRTELVAPNGLLVSELDRLTDLFGAAEHICIRRLTVVLRIHVSPATGSADIRRAWLAAARKILRDLPESAVRRLEPGILVSVDGDVVIYQRHLDAITDLVRSLSATTFRRFVGQSVPREQDVERAWAWEQCGLYSGPLPRSAAARREVMTRVLTAAPEVIPAVLARVDAALPLELMQWVELAAAWTRSQEPVDAVRALHHPDRPAPVHVGTEIVADSPILRLALQSPVARALAAHSQSVARLPITERQMLARLALACSAPHHSRAASVDAVAQALATARPEPVPINELPSDAPPRTEAAALIDAELQLAPLEPIGPVSTVRDDDPPQDSRPQYTAYGGLLFLALAIDPVVTEIVVDDLPDVLARLCERLAGVPPTDPAVQALAGLDPDRPIAPPDDELDALIEDRIRTWMLDRPDPDRTDDDLAWVWERQAAVELGPGWIDAEFSLDDVDLRIRRAGLDLDPGWLWWRGAVLRYRYV